MGKIARINAKKKFCANDNALTGRMGTGTKDFGHGGYWEPGFTNS
jgi:hypothetical protein